MTQQPQVVVRRAVAAVGSAVEDNSRVAPEEVLKSTGFRTRRVAAAGEGLFSLSLKAAKACLEGASGVCGVVCASFSRERRFPGLATGLAGALDLAPDIPAIDIQAACSAFPQALFVAGAIAAAREGSVLVVDGDVQSPFVDALDASTAPLFSDASTATLVSADRAATSRFEFLSRPGDALSCGPSGPVKMDGFKVFSFVATDVVRMLRGFGGGFDFFVPHQANMYMVRSLARSLGLEERLVTCGEEFANPGSCSIPLALAAHGSPGTALLAGFGAGLSAAAATVRVADGFSGEVLR